MRLTQYNKWWIY